MKIKRLTPEIFERVADNTELEDQTRAMARAVLVDGRAQVDVATEYGVTKQRVNLAVGSINRAYFKFSTSGDGVVRVELDLPEVLALELGAVADTLMLCADAAQKEAVIKKLLAAAQSARKQLA